MSADLPALRRLGQGDRAVAGHRVSGDFQMRRLLLAVDLDRAMADDATAQELRVPADIDRPVIGNLDLCRHALGDRVIGGADGQAADAVDDHGVDDHFCVALGREVEVDRRRAR